MNSSVRQMKKNGFCEKKFRSMLVSGTLTVAVLYLMLLCDRIIAGFFIGEAGVAAINVVTPVTDIVTFFANIVSVGAGILYSREIGAMHKRRADEIFGQGFVLSAGIAVVSAVLLIVFRDAYFSASGVTGEIHDLAAVYYRWTPLNTVLNVMVFYFEELVYADGDETCNNTSYIVQIGGNVVFSVLLTRSYGMLGIIFGTMIGNALGILVSCQHFFSKRSTLHFVWHISLKDIAQSVRFSIVDAVIYFCWAVMDYVLIGFVSSRYGDDGLVTLAVVVSLIEFGVVLDGVGLAVQPLLGTYLGEKNNLMIRRLMRVAVKAALLEGIAASVLVFLFAKQFAGLFGITGGAVLAPSVRAVRIVAPGLVFCSAFSLLSSYYMLIDHVALSVAVTVLKDGLLYSFLPLLGSALAGEDGMWASFTASPVLALAASLLFIYFRYGKARFPYLLEPTQAEIVVLDDVLTPEHCALLSARVQEEFQKHGYPEKEGGHAALFTEEIGLTVLERNKASRKPLLVEFSLFFEKESVLVIERDSGEVFDITDPDAEIRGFSGFVLSGLMAAQKEKAYLTTTGYNRNMILFPNDPVGTATIRI